MTKVLYVDVETSPIQAEVWDIWNQNVGTEQITEDRSIFCWSALWHGDPDDAIMCQSVKRNKNFYDDKKLLKPLWALLDEADVVIGHNSQSFDEKRINTRLLINGYGPPSPYKSVDTLRIARSTFDFTSNKMGYIAKQLKTEYQKYTARSNTGHLLWRNCVKGEQQAWDEMELYNKIDVWVLRNVCAKLLPWAKDINLNTYHDGDNYVCTCGSAKHQKRGYAYTSQGKYQRYMCAECGAWSRDKVNLHSKEKRRSLKVRI